MTGTPTTNWGFPTYDGTEPGSLKTVSNAQANAAETAMNNASKSFYLQFTTKTLLNSYSTTGLRVGQHATVYADSTSTNNGDYVWSGSAWGKVLNSGMVQIYPTSVTGTGTVTVSTSGEVQFSVANTASSIIVNGVTGYRGYRVVLRTYASGDGAVAPGGTTTGTTDTATSLQACSAGVIDTTTHYIINSTGGFTGWSNLGPNAQNGRMITFEIAHLSQAAYTHALVSGSGFSAAGIPAAFNGALACTTLTAYDGLAFSFGTSGRAAGTIQIYGYLD